MRRELEVMRVLRVPPLGKLVVEVNGERVQNLSEIKDEKAGRVVLAAVGELIDFVGGYKALVSAGVAPAQTGRLPALEEPLLEERQAEFLARLEAERDILQKTPLRKQKLSDLGDQLESDASLADAVELAGQELSVAEQIDRILQRYISANPMMAGRSVHLMQEQTGGIGIEVDGKIYQQPGDIPDARIQDLIKRAVKEWDAA